MSIPPFKAGSVTTTFGSDGRRAYEQMYGTLLRHNLSLTYDEKANQFTVNTPYKQKVLKIFAETAFTGSYEPKVVNRTDKKNHCVIIQLQKRVP